MNGNSRTRVSACTNHDLELIAEAAQGDMRRAILMLQVAFQTGSCNNLAELSESETCTIAASAIGLIKSGDLPGDPPARVADDRLRALGRDCPLGDPDYRPP